VAWPGFAIALNADLVDDDVQRAVAESRAGREVLCPRCSGRSPRPSPAIDPLARVERRQVVDIRPGDVIYTPADEWHWHGAAPDHFMTHLSITEAVPGNERPEADWGEHVTDDEYDDR
jgi:hypothetical protein